MIYQRRIIDDLLDELQPHLRAVALFGPKSVGKTATAAHRATTVFDLSDTTQREIVAGDLGLLASSAGPVLVDEWQRMPEIWDAIKRAVDQGTPPGHFLIAGSSAPRGAVVHSGAGRIVPMRMRPLSMAERHPGSATVSLRELLNGDSEIAGVTDVALVDYVEEITASGFPGLRNLPARVRRAELDAYLENVVQRDFPEQGYSVRRPEVLRQWLTAYAAATASTASYSKLLDAATPGIDDKPAKSTTIAYRDALTSLWLLDPVPAWLPGHNHLDRVGKAPKHMLADPALAARLLGLDASALMRGDQGRRNLNEGTALGALFESLAAQSIMTYAEAAESRAYHMRMLDNNREVDLIVARPDGRVLAIEVKLSASLQAVDVKHLHWLRERIGDELIDAVVVNTGGQAYRRQDGIAVVPLALLGP